MVDEKVFRDTWALLCDRFGRQPSTPLMLAYYKTISPQLTTEQFKTSAQQIFVEREFFPRPADFIDGARPDPKASALRQWEQVQELMRGGNADLNLEARRVVRLLGGTRKLQDSPVNAEQYIRRDFLELYADVSDVARRDERIAPTPEGNRLTDQIMASARLSAGQDAE